MKEVSRTNVIDVLIVFIQMYLFIYVCVASFILLTEFSKRIKNDIVVLTMPKCLPL